MMPNSQKRKRANSLTKRKCEIILDRVEKYDYDKEEIIESLIPGEYVEFVRTDLRKRGITTKYTDRQIGAVRRREMYIIEIAESLERIADEEEKSIDLPLTK